MSTICYTSFSFSYLDRARVLASTLKERHPDWTLWAVITDEPPAEFPFDADDELFDRIIWGQEMFADLGPGWLFRHDVVELCTAVKGRALRLALEEGPDMVVYLDPDIGVLNPLDDVVEALETHSVVLTPHQVDPNSSARSLADNELTSLQLGTYNLGFLGVRNDATGMALAHWWEARLEQFCYDEPGRGIFVDQKWCDLIPSLFDGVKVLRDPGYNVASWNLSQRRVEIRDSGEITVNDVPLRFFHFTKLGVLGDTMTRRYARNNVDVFEIWGWYRRLVMAYRDARIPERYWHFANYSDGEAIPKQARVLYRQRLDLQRAFPDPFESGENSFQAWMRTEAPAAS